MAYAVLAHADLKSINLASCSVSHSFSRQQPVHSVSLNVTAACSVIEDVKRLVVQAKFTVRAEAEHDPQESLLIEFTYLLGYQLDSTDGLTTANYNAFTRWIGLNNAWPYAREFVQSMTQRLGLPSLKLPLFKVEVDGKGGEIVHD